MRAFGRFQRFLLYSTTTIVNGEGRMLPFPTLDRNGHRVTSNLIFMLRTITRSIFCSPLRLLTICKGGNLYRKKLRDRVRPLLVRVIDLFASVVHWVYDSIGVFPVRESLPRIGFKGRRRYASRTNRIIQHVSGRIRMVTFFF